MSISKQYRRIVRSTYALVWPYRRILFLALLGVVLLYRALNYVAPPIVYDVEGVELITLGSTYGGWSCDAAPLTEESIVYSVGLGGDTTWDEALLATYNLWVCGVSIQLHCQRDM